MKKQKYKLFDKVNFSSKGHGFLGNKTIKDKGEITGVEVNDNGEIFYRITCVDKSYFVLQSDIK